MHVTFSVHDFGNLKQPKDPMFCVDIGAPKSVVGLPTLSHIFRRRPPRLRNSRNTFRFGDDVVRSIGKCTLFLATPPGICPIRVTVDVVEVDVPPLLGLDILDSQCLTADTVLNRLVKRTIIRGQRNEPKYALDDWSMPMKRKDNHVYVPMVCPITVNFSRQQLEKMHKNFFHPSTTKLFNLIRRARPEEATPETRKILEDISKSCDPCQRIQIGPKRFRVSLGSESVIFNERVLIDIMYIENKPILHVVDELTHFSAARFLPNVSTGMIWETFLSCWALIYTGLPNRILVDQGSSLSDQFIAFGKLCNVDISQTGVEAHSSLGIGERYHQPLRNTFRKLSIAYPRVSKASLLAMSVKAMNDTLGPEGLVPSALVFGEFPQLRAPGEGVQPRPDLAERALIAKKARDEMALQMSRLRLQRALRHNPPDSANTNFEPGNRVLVWREKLHANRIGEWCGPYSITHTDDERKLAHIDLKEGQPRPFNYSQIKHYTDSTHASNSFFASLSNSLHSFSSSRIANPDGVYLTEIIAPNDPRASLPAMTAAMKAEVKGLLERKTFKVILREDIPPDGNVLPGRFVLAIKSTHDNKVKFKARFVIGGHRDKLKKLMVHSSQTIQPSSIRLLLTIAAAKRFELWTSDVRQAYLQSDDPLSRDVYLRDPPPEFELAPHECLQLLKPLYGLCESGDMWYKTLDNHHRQDLGMAPLRTDPALYALSQSGDLKGLSGSYVDDMIRAGTPEFKKACQTTHDKFEMTDDGNLPFTFSGFQLQHNGTNDDTLEIHQRKYLSTLKPIPSDATFSHFRSSRMKLSWLSHTRPDLLYEVSQAAQVTEDKYNADSKRYIKRLNSTIKYATENAVSISVPRLNLRSARIVGFSDASFANNEDNSTQLGYIIFIVDNDNLSVPIHFKSYKARRIVRSVLGGELIAFSDMFDTAFALASEMRALLPQCKMPVSLLTDNKSLFDVISKGSRTSERRLMLDIACAREGFRQHDISDIGFIRSNDNIADGLTKRMTQAKLCNSLKGTLLVEPEQWIIREQPC